MLCLWIISSNAKKLLCNYLDRKRLQIENEQVVNFLILSFDPNKCFLLKYMFNYVNVIISIYILSSIDLFTDYFLYIDTEISEYLEWTNKINKLQALSCREMALIKMCLIV